MKTSTALRTSLWIILPAFALLYLAGRFRVASEPPLRHYAVVPPFSLTERSGRTVTKADLAGKIWVAEFIFTTCPGP